MVSIIMPTYNGEKYLNETIMSVLNQSYKNWELIIIDDYSTDNTRHILQELSDSRINVYYNDKNEGIAYTRNKGITLARGEYIALLDQDDIYSQDKLYRQVSYLEKHKDIDIVGAKVQWIDDNNMIISPPSDVLLEPEDILSQSLLENPFCNCEILMRSCIFSNENLRYEDKMYGMEDYHFWVRCLKDHRASNIDKVLFYHRIIGNNETSRVMRDNVQQKKLTYDKIRRLAFEINGIKINDKKLMTLFSQFGIYGNTPFATYAEFEYIYNVMRSIYHENYYDEKKREALSFIFRRKINSTLLWSNKMWWSDNKIVPEDSNAKFKNLYCSLCERIKESQYDNRIIADCKEQFNTTIKKYSDKEFWS